MIAVDPPARSGSKSDECGLIVAAKGVGLTFAAPPGETTHWTGAAMARAAGVSISAVQRIWRAHGFQPHRVRKFKRSNDPEFVDKLAPRGRSLCRSAVPTPWCSASTKRAKSRRSIVLSPACR